MMDDDTELSVVLVDQPGRERDALRAMLVSMSGIRMSGVLDECPENLPAPCPDVAIIKIRLLSEHCLERIKAQREISPLPQFLIIADTIEQVKTFTANGIDKVLMTGFTNNELYQVLEQCQVEKLKTSLPL
jgi:hypothetical protein